MSGRTIFYNAQTDEFSFERPAVLTWSREQEILGREFTPANLHETARLRVAIRQNSAVAAELIALEAARTQAKDPEAKALAALRVQVVDALDRGGCIRCPRCGVRAVKDDACIHMSCVCGCRFCFLCVKEDCPRGGGGCDEGSIHLESKAGWGEFALPGESSAHGAQQEFYRRRQAFNVRAVMEVTDPNLWQKLRKMFPELLSNTPSAGRSIAWDSLASAEMPVFGASQRLQMVGASEEREGFDIAAQRRFAEHWVQVRLEQERDTLRAAQRSRHQLCCLPALLVLASVLVAGTHLLLSSYTPPSPVQLVEAANATTAAAVLPEPEPASPAELRRETDQVCNVACQAIGFWKASELLLGLLFIIIGNCRHFGNWAIFCRGWQHLQAGDKMVTKTVALVLIACALYWPLAVASASVLAVSAPVGYLLGGGAAAVSALWVLLAADMAWCTYQDRAFRLDQRMSTAGDMAAIGWVGAAVVTFVVLLGRARVDILTHELIAPTSQFSCDGLCRSLPYLALVLMLVGSAAGAAALFAWIIQGTRRKKDVLIWFAASAVFAPVFFWPAVLEREIWVRASGLVAYFIAPVGAFVFGPIWVGGQFVVALEQLRHDVRVPVVLLVSGCAGVSLFIVWVLAVSRVRNDNADVMLSGDLMREVACGAACQYLKWVPLTELAIGTSLWLVALVLVSRGRGSERAGCFSVCMAGFCMSSGPTLLWSFESSMDSLASAHWLMAFVVAPVISGVGLPCFVAVCFMTAVQTAYSRDFYSVIGEWTRRGEDFFLCCVAVAILFSTAAYISCVAVVRANSASVHRTDDHEGVIIYSYHCTWPCVSLRVVSCVAAGSAAIALWRLSQSRFVLWLAEHPAPDRTQRDADGQRFVGQRVEALYPNGRFYAATIAEIHNDGAAFTLNWDDGDGTHRRQPAANLRNIGGQV